MKKNLTSSPPGNSDTFWDIIRSQAVLWLTHLVTTELHIYTSGWPSLAISIQKSVRKYQFCHSLTNTQSKAMRNQNNHNTCNYVQTFAPPQLICILLGGEFFGLGLLDWYWPLFLILRGPKGNTNYGTFFSDRILLKVLVVLYEVG